jgi:IS5 family transposase
VLGRTDPQRELLDADEFCGHLVKDDSIFRHMAELRERLFTDEDFADLYDPRQGRHSVPPSLVASVSLLQRFFGTSDRETMDRVQRDIGWKVALGLPLSDEGFDPTVLCYFRERMRRSARPNRIFERFKEIAGEAGLLDKRTTRVLDSTPILSAVQTQDTVSLIKGGVRRLLAALDKGDPHARRKVAGALRRTDYGEVGKPAIDWDDQEARIALVDELVVDALAALSVLEGRKLPEPVNELAEILATVAGQDVERGKDGRFRIVRGVHRDRVISTVDPEARHGRKSKRAPFDGYKAHVAVEPESEIITEVEVAPANVPEMAVIDGIVPELRDQDAEVTIVGDAAYGSGPAREVFQKSEARVTLISKAPPDRNSTGGFAKSQFHIDLAQGTATCPARITTAAVRHRAGVTRFQFPAVVCAACPLRAACTSSERGRSVSVGPHESLLSAARAWQRTDEFKLAYRSTRPTVERVISRLVRRGGRKARYRRRSRVHEQLLMKAAVENFVTMARKGLSWTGPAGWAIA